MSEERRVDGDVGVITISGSVLYRERVALPPGAVVTIGLCDLSSAEVPPPVVAERVIEPDHQVPVPFTLTVPCADLDAADRYCVTAQIAVDGRLRWISDAPCEVSPTESTAGVTIVLVAVDTGPIPPSDV